MHVHAKVPGIAAPVLAREQSAARRKPPSTTRTVGSRRAASSPAQAERRSSKKIVMIGNGPGVKGILSALGELSVECVWVRSIDDLDETLARDALAIVWSSMGAERGFGRSIDRLRQTTGLPIFAVVRNESRDALVRGLYRLGVAGVFAWPREGLLLARYVAEMLSLRMVRGPARDSDAALARTVRAHLRHLPIANRPLQVEVDDGRVSLRGSVDLLAHRDEIEHQVSMVPGVTGLDVSDIRVEQRTASDAAIRAACRRLIGAQLETRTVTAKVHNGVVLLEGSVPDRQYSRRLRELAAHIQGVCDVENAITVSRRQARRDRGALRRLQNLLKTLFADAKFQLAFHGGVAVLDGEVPTLHVKRSMERVLEQDRSVTRIVNKLSVRPQ